MRSEEPVGKWRGIHGGTIDEPFVGAHVIDVESGLRGQIEAVMDERLVRVRLEDGRVVETRIRPG